MKQDKTRDRYDRTREKLVANENGTPGDWWRTKREV